MQNNFQRLLKKIDYTFSNEIFLKQALTHCSAGAVNNERLEFLGDSILSFVITKALYEKFPEQSEGVLSRLRAHLVKGDTLAEIALELDLGDYLSLGQGELKSGGFRRSSILADALEALFAAILLDGGIEASKHVVLHLYRLRLEDPALNNNLKDAKTQLQEYLQAKKLPLPLYHLISTDGAEHDQIFHVVCEVRELSLKTTGLGDTRRKAEQFAATALLSTLKQDN